MQQQRPADYPNLTDYHSYLFNPLEQTVCSLKYSDLVTVWQIAAGASQREYHDLFVRHGLAFVGGADNERALCQVQLGDIIALKKGTSKILAIGKVVERNGAFSGFGDKDWLNDFDGWNLRAWINVDWRLPEKELAPRGLSRGTILRIKKGDLRDKVLEAYSRSNPIESIESEPVATNGVTDEEIINDLIRFGLSPIQAENLTAAFVRVRRLARYYRENCRWEEVKEHEARTFLVTPLLLALGWSEQQIKIELGVKMNSKTGKIDMACFSKPFHVAEDRNCRLLIETKGYAQGLDYAPNQAKEYAKQFPEAPNLVVTNGYCYKLFVRNGNEYPDAPSAYMNLLHPRDRYPLDPVRTGGCLELLRALVPG